MANVVSPGLVRTDATRRQPEENFRRSAAMTPLGRVAAPQDIAKAIVACCGEGVEFVTGAYLPVNGGSAMD